MTNEDRCHTSCPSGLRQTGRWRQAAVEDRRTPVPDLAAFRIDFADWLKTLTRRDRRVVAALASGEGTGAVAGRFGLSAGRVSQLRRKYEASWQNLQGEGREEHERRPTA